MIANSRVLRQAVFACLVGVEIADMREHYPFSILAAACRCLPAAPALIIVKANSVLPAVPGVSGSSIPYQHAATPLLLLLLLSTSTTSRFPAILVLSAAAKAPAGRVPLRNVCPPLLGLAKR
jgi:hypothetical protein